MGQLSLPVVQLKIATSLDPESPFLVGAGRESEERCGNWDCRMNDPEILDTLRAEREAVRNLIRTMTSDFDGIVEDSLHSNADDEHDPEGSTIAYERAQIAALITAAQSSLDDLDDALARVSAGRYSVCEQCGEPISLERLTALPACRTCYECAVSGYSR